MTPVTCFKSSTFEDVTHGFFGRQGGVSEGLVSSLNCYGYINAKTQQIDNDVNVLLNRQIILATLDLQASDITSANQIHGDTIVTVNQPRPMDFTHADGIITRIPNVPIGILTADCVPILYVDINRTLIGVAHAGWKGTFLEIHLKMIAKFNQMGVPSKDIKAVVGPSIQQASYEVDHVFYDRFILKNERYQSYFSPSITSEHYMFDLPRIVYDDLMAASLHSVDWLKLDTVVQKEDFFSHRRATLGGTSVTGRQLSVVSL